MDRHIESYYVARSTERDRLREGSGWIEFERTRELIRRHLPEGPLRILDVGGAAGIHAEWLAGDGHVVHLIDPMPRHIEQAEELASRLGNPFTCQIGDARELEEADGSTDVVLLLGPLYHLTERSERVLALSEARRVLRPGGVCFAVGISRFASLLDGLARGMLADPAFAAIVRQDLLDGQHRNPDGVPSWFTTAYFHHPDELEAEAREAGLDVDALLGIEGPAGWIPAGNPLLDDPAHREIVLESARNVESEPSLRGLSAHMLLVACKRETDSAATIDT